MGKRKRNLTKISLCFTLLGLLACGKNETLSGHQQPSETANQERGEGLEYPESFDESTYPGRVVSSSPQEDFQYGVDNFVSSFMDPISETNGIGLVSGTQGNDTGVWLNGYLRVPGGLAPDQSYNLNIEEGFINVLIWDEFSGQELNDGNGIIPGIKVRALLLEGSITGKKVTLRFQYQDREGRTLGYLELEGAYDHEDFSGDFYFYNEVFYNQEYTGSGCDEKGACGKMGGFYIPTCQVFTCNE